MYSYVGHSILDFLYLDAEWLLNMAHQLCFIEPDSEIKEPKGKAVRHMLSVHGQHIVVFWALAWQHGWKGAWEIKFRSVQKGRAREEGVSSNIPFMGMLSFISSQSPPCEHSTTCQW